MSELSIRDIDSREEMIRFFDGQAVKSMEELDSRKQKRPLVKSYLLELMDCEESYSNNVLSRVFNRQGVSLKPVDESLFIVHGNGDADIGFLEALSPRIFSLYSMLQAKEVTPWVNRLVMTNPELDHVWLSGETFNVLWEFVTKLSKPNRFSRLAFTHDSIFDLDSPSRVEDEEIEEEVSDDNSDSEDLQKDIIEHRATKFTLQDRIGVIQEKLEQLQDIYSPLLAISQLRFPSPVGRGGHDFHYNGQVTNRSDNFLDHRNHVLFVVRIYEKLLESTETEVWYSVEETVDKAGHFSKLVGAPIIINFKEDLDPVVFKQWINSTFKSRPNKFRLWGNPIFLGNDKVHVYGVDRHLWQPIFLELTRKGCVMIIPNGTCGNTVHRFVTNIQRFVDPGADTYIGDKPYKEMLEALSNKVKDDFQLI